MHYNVHTYIIWSCWIVLLDTLFCLKKKKEQKKTFRLVETIKKLNTGSKTALQHWSLRKTTNIYWLVAQIFVIPSQQYEWIALFISLITHRCLVSIIPPFAPPGMWWQRWHCKGPAPSEHSGLWSLTRRSKGGKRRRGQNQDPHPHPAWQQGGLVGPCWYIHKIQGKISYLFLSCCLICLKHQGTLTNFKNYFKNSFKLSSSSTSIDAYREAIMLLQFLRNQFLCFVLLCLGLSFFPALTPTVFPKIDGLVDTQSPIWHLRPILIVNKEFGNDQAVPEIRTPRHHSGLSRRWDLYRRWHFNRSHRIPGQYKVYIHDNTEKHVVTLRFLKL